MKHKALCLALLFLPSSIATMAAVLTVNNQTAITLQAKFKKPNQAWQYTNIPSQQSHDFNSETYFSVTLYDPEKPYLAITSEQYSDGLGFRPERHSPTDRCNDYQCAFSLIGSQHGQLSIKANTPA